MLERSPKKIWKYFSTNFLKCPKKVARIRVARLMLSRAVNFINLGEKRKRNDKLFVCPRVHLLRHNNLHNFSILFHSMMIIKYYADVDDDDDDHDYDYDYDYYWRLVWLTMRPRRTGCDNYVHGILAMRHMTKQKPKTKLKPKLKLAQVQRVFCFSILSCLFALFF